MKTYREIAEHYGLKGITADLYVAYMQKRWTDTEEQKCQDGYAGEWAERFLTNSEWEMSDSEGQLVLKELLGK